MIAYAPYAPADSHAVVALWNSSELGVGFPLDARLWRQNVEQSAFTRREATLVARDEGGGIVGVIVCKAPKNLGAIVVRAESRRRGIASELVRRAAAVMFPDGEGSWTIGQDRNHFFPGVPEEADAAMAFFASLGIVAAEGAIFDLHRDLSGYAVPPQVAETIAALRAEHGIVLAPCREQDLGALVDHISANFSERWLSDTVARLDAETNPSEIIVARREATGEIAGFAHTYSNRSRYIGPSISWRALLGPKYGGLGPIGVGKDVRKIGLGLALLSYAIQSVKDRGATRMAIDWTVIVDFYAKVGFTPWKRYIALRKP